jgi:predicted nucleotidyltransferase
MDVGSIIDDHRMEIEALCQTYRVLRLDVFGSVVRDDFDPEQSDVDFLVEFVPDPHRNRFRDYFALRDALARVLGRPVDLVMARAVANPYLRAAIDSERRPVYAA